LQNTPFHQKQKEKQTNKQTNKTTQEVGTKVKGFEEKE